MTERAQKIMKAYEAEDTYNFPKDGVAAAIREIANCFKWDSYGLAQLSADDFIELADELEKYYDL
jgi:hypothetical protein